MWLIYSTASSNKFRTDGLETEANDCTHRFLRSPNIFYLQIHIDDEKHRIVDIIRVDVRNESIVSRLRLISAQFGGSIREIRHLEHLLVCENLVVSRRIYGGTISVVELSQPVTAFGDYRLQLRVLRFFRLCLIVDHFFTLQIKTREQFARASHATISKLCYLLLLPVVDNYLYFVRSN